MAYKPKDKPSCQKEDRYIGKDKPDKALTPSRPFSVTLLALVVLTITGIHLIRFLRAIYLWDFLSDLPGISPLYLTLTGLIWSIIGLLLVWWIWRGYPHSPKITRIAALTYTLYFWLDRTLVAGALVERPNDSFVVGVNILLLVFTFWVLSRPNVTSFFLSTDSHPGTKARLSSQE